jgi:hypothetical protein
VNILNTSHTWLSRGDPPAWGLDKGLITLHHKKQLVMKCFTGPHNWMDSGMTWAVENGYEIQNMEC